MLYYNSDNNTEQQLRLCKPSSIVRWRASALTVALTCLSLARSHTHAASKTATTQTGTTFASLQHTMLQTVWLSLKACTATLTLARLHLFARPTGLQTCNSQLATRSQLTARDWRAQHTRTE